ncbi:hypothetical protein BB560_002597 [Smittium megazygosporum]|uniref:Metallo-beta-lactamase domain-containing protein n=1 Tax=Smittium megazygosporum TaxID=133381 RepID=A0A2T9ZEB7_9FUNG|nr:hypothetical protein BB560_002597 [Smittium megazygosporum]
MTAVQLSKRVWLVNALNPGPFTLTGTNTYVVGTGKERVLIDTGDGAHPEYIENLKKALDTQMDNARISAILLTHYHHDHVDGVPLLLKESGITTGDFHLYAAKNCTPSSTRGIFKKPDPSLDSQFIQKWGADVHINPIKTNSAFTKFSEYYEKQKTYMPQTEISNLVCSETNFCLSVQGATIYAIDTPGHCNDHTSFFLKEDNAIFSGDCLLGNSSTIFTNLKNILFSLQLFLSLSPTTVYPGHGPTIEHPTETQIKRNIAHRLEKEQKILDILAKYKNELLLSHSSPPDSDSIPSLWITTSALLDLVYGPLKGETLIRGATLNLVNHLDKLESDGKVSSKTLADNSKLWFLL